MNKTEYCRTDGGICGNTFVCHRSNRFVEHIARMRSKHKRRSKRRDWQNGFKYAQLSDIFVCELQSFFIITVITPNGAAVKSTTQYRQDIDVSGTCSLHLYLIKKYYSKL